MFDNRWITVPQLVNAFYVITKNEIGMNIAICRAVMLHFRSKSNALMRVLPPFSSLKVAVTCFEQLGHSLVMQHWYAGDKLHGRININA